MTWRRKFSADRSADVTHTAEKLGFDTFDAAMPLDGLASSTQEQYVRGYLTDHGAKVVVTEPRYFDRDYLSEFSAFFGASARGYVNICRRLHFFASALIDRALLTQALDGDAAALNAMKDSYLGFVVVRPIAATPFGRSVLKMYPPDAARPPRCTNPHRLYRPHLAGLELEVEGVAWQQQDASVSTCATVALWTMLQASAFDEHHAIPTTTTLTRLANDAALSRGRVFPSDGLTAFQLSRAIRAAELEPMIADPRQSPEVFSSIIASLVRSRFPVLVTGDIKGDGHAVCVVGFRESAVSPPPPRLVTPQDTSLEAVYVHDDNLGPNVRFEIKMALPPPAPGAPPAPARLQLHPAPPMRAIARGSVTLSYPPLSVSLVVAAVPEGLRVSVTAVHRVGARLAGIFLNFLNSLLAQAGQPEVGFTFTARFARVAEYLAEVLPTAVPKGALGRARLAFVETVPPTSLFVAIVRVGSPGNPLFDLVFDSTDGDHHLRTWCTVAFHPVAHGLLTRLTSSGFDDFGLIVNAS